MLLEKNILKDILKNIDKDAKIKKVILRGTYNSMLHEEIRYTFSVRGVEHKIIENNDWIFTKELIICNCNYGKSIRYRKIYKLVEKIYKRQTKEALNRGEQPELVINPARKPPDKRPTPSPPRKTHCKHCGHKQ